MPDEQKTDSTQKVVNDNLINVVTQLGVANRARTPASSFFAPKDLSYQELENIYGGDGFGKRIVDVYANEMVREWFKLKGDPDNLILTYLTNMKAKKNFGNGLKWARLYGSSIIIMLIDDGRDLSESVSMDDIKKVESLRVIDRTQLSIKNPDDWYSDPTKGNFGTPMIYTVNPIRITSNSKLNANEYQVHESRVLRFDGEIMPNRIMNENNSFGISVLKPIYNQLINLGQSYGYTSEILHEFITSIISIKNLSSILATPDGDALIKARMESMSYCKSVINGIVIDADGENYQKQTTNVSGITDIIDKFALALSAVSGIPYMILMGESPSGLNANGDNSIRAWYDSIAAEQDELLGVELNKLINYILLARDNPLKGKTIDDVEIVFNSLWQYDEPTQIDMRNKQAQSDQIYLQNGVVMPGEIAESRFGGEQYSYETVITSDLRDSSDANDQTE